MKKQILILLIAEFLAFQVMAQIIVNSGVCGDNCTYSLTDNGTLIVKGTGQMWDYTYDNRSESPFYGNNAIKKIIVENGITKIGERIFTGCTVQNIELADSVETVAKRAFDNIGTIKTITMSENTMWEDQENFNDSSAAPTIKIYCRGNLEVCKNNLTQNQRYYSKGATAVYKGKRIYTIEEANKVTGKKNSVGIRYK